MKWTKKESAKIAILVFFSKPRDTPSEVGWWDMLIWNRSGYHCERYRPDTISSTDGWRDGHSVTSIPTPSPTQHHHPINFVGRVYNDNTPVITGELMSRWQPPCTSSRRRPIGPENCAVQILLPECYSGAEKVQLIIITTPGPPV